jgi:dTDP-4-amino-4,6-dideoxygalactose transaminase
VPFFDLSPSHATVKADILEDIRSLTDSGAFINGPAVASFEHRFAEFCGASECVGVASGLDALRLALIAAGIERGDEVIVPAATFIATLEAVTQAGGRPVLVDVTETDYCLDLELAAAAVTSRTRFVLPVHLYGQMTDMHGVRRLADTHGLEVVEDACQAHGASREGLRAGVAGTSAGAFSFYPSKNLGAFGDAGALVTDDPELAATVRALREHGQRGKYRHDLEGFTARLDTMQAIVLLNKLPHLEAWNEERRRAAALYTEQLDAVDGLALPNVPSGSEPVWHLYVVRTEDPESLGSHLALNGIGTGRHYPEPPHLSAAYGWLGYTAGDFPVAERLSREGISLPIFPGIRPEQIEVVATTLAEHYAS